MAIAWKRKAVRGCAALAIGYVIALVIQEFAIANRYLASEPNYKMELCSRGHGKDTPPFDRRRPLKVIHAAASAGRVLVPALFPQDSWNGTAPIDLGRGPELILGGMARVPTLFCNELGGYSTFEADRFGFNNRDALWDERANVLLVGDSFAQGACVSPSETISARLTELVGSSLSLGMSGNGPLTNLATLREWAEVNLPRVIVWLHFEGNDLWDLQKEVEQPLLARYFEGKFSAALYARRSEIEAAKEFMLQRKLWVASAQEQWGWRWRNWWNTHPDWQLLLRVHPLRNHLGWASKLPDTWQDSQTFARVMRLAKQWTDARGVEFLVAYLPSAESLGNSAKATTREEVMRVLKAEEIRTTDLAPALMALGPRAYSCGGEGHLTPEGYSEVAREIARAVVSFARRNDSL